jgi:hypothetical protein
MAMGLDGELFDGIPIKLRRPKEYQPLNDTGMGYEFPGIDVFGAADSEDKIFVGMFFIYFFMTCKHN